MLATGRGLATRARFADPTSFLAAFVAWSVINAISLLTSRHAFSLSDFYGPLRALGIPEWGWGIAMLADGAGLAASMFLPSFGLRASIAALSGLFWSFYGAELTLGGWRVGVLAVSGVWDLACGLKLFLACLQWTNRRTAAWISKAG